MDPVLLDEWVRIVLGQLPRLLSTAVPLDDKLSELSATAVEALGLDDAAVVLLDDPVTVVHTPGVPEAVIARLRDADGVRALLQDDPTAPLVPLVPLENTGGDVLVALRHGVHTYGALYAAVGDRGRLGPDEGESLTLFAQAVGPALHHGIRLLSTERGERWGKAAVALTERLLADEVTDPLEAVVDVVWELGEADGIGIIAPEGDGLAVRKGRGLGLDRLVGVRMSAVESVSFGSVSFGRGMRADGRMNPSSWLTQHHPEIELGPGIAVPLLSGQEMLGVLYLVRSPHGPPFSDDALRTAETFGINAAISLEWHAARRTQDELRTLQERNRIARDLHDNVVQRLFATGLYLQQASRTLDGDAKERVMEATRAVDQTIRQIRNTILVLRSTDADRLGQLLTGIVAETAVLLGFSPTITMSPTASRVSGPLAADLALCAREAFSNVVQHAQATMVELRAEVEESTLVLSISDDGVGITGQQVRPGGGLDNLAERARAHGGSFAHTSEPGGGSTLTWRMPLER